MAGEIPSNDDLNDLFGNKKDAEEAPTFDDATTAYTKDDIKLKTSKEPLIAVRRLRSPPITIEADEGSVEIEDDSTAVHQPTFSNDGDLQLPSIYSSYQTVQPLQTINQKSNKRRLPPQEKDTSLENLFIYKDFDTSLTKVKGAIKNMPLL